jgi:hypothetical protein
MTRKEERLPQRFGMPWNAEEDHAVTEMFKAGNNIETIAAAQYRTRSSVRMRLEKLGLVEPPSERDGQ